MHGRRRLAALLAGSALLLPLLPSAVMRLGTWGDRYDDAAVAPTRAVALVLGAGVEPGGNPTEFLRQRLDLARDLYDRHRVRAILVTGDHGREHHDEPGSMKAYLVRAGVPAADITEDHAGFSTYDSCFRAKAVFGVREAVVVTQGYHLPRAVFTCQRLGIDAVGLGGSELSRHPHETVSYSLREVLSSVKAAWQLVLRPAPHFLGPHETGLDQANRAGRP
jgi:vancomycin permeability regulator SanA